MLAPFFLLLCVALAASGPSDDMKARKHIMLITPPSHSHVVSLREVAIGLKEEYPDYRVTFVTGSRFLKTLPADSGIEGLVGVLPDENCQNIGIPPELAAQLSNLPPGDPRFIEVIAHLIPATYECMFDPLDELLKKEKPDFLFLDHFATAARDLAVQHCIEYGLLGALGMGEIGFEVWLPPGHIGGRLEDMHNFKFRFMNLFQIIKMMRYMIPGMDALQRPRDARGFAPIKLGEMHKDRLILLAEVWGFNYARPVGPLIQHIGFLSPPHDSPRAAMFTNPEKDQKIFDWLDSLPENAFVTYVAFGSQVQVPQLLIDRIILGLLQADPNIYVLIAIRDNIEATIDSIPRELKSRVRQESWVPQTQILHHPRIKVFVTHGGLSSIAESVHADVPMLAFPFFADQPRNGYQLQDAGAGMVFIHTDFSDEDFVMSVQKMKNNYTQFQSSVVKLRKISEVTGGRKAAARKIHEYVQIGGSHLRNIQNQFTVVERFNLDILVILAVVALTVLYTAYRGLKAILFGVCFSAAVNHVVVASPRTKPTTHAPPKPLS